MSAPDIPQETRKFEIQAYKKPADIKSLREEHVAFTGSPQKHPYDSEKIVLITDPYSGVNTYYEFSTEDISCVEELPNIVNMNEETITMVRVWIKKRSIGIRCTPFLVEEL